MKRKTRRLITLVGALVVLTVGVAVVLTAFRDNLIFFYSPTELKEQTIAGGRAIRIGGLVEEGSLVRDADSLGVTFRVTDLVNTVAVAYRGALPDLFREGQGVVVEGTIDGPGRLTASQVLAKHDETYMPPEVAEALKKSGQWKGAK